MKFADYILDVLTRVATIDGSLISSRINGNGALTVQLIAVYEGEAAILAEVSEDSSDAQRAAFELHVDLFENAVKADAAEEAANEAKVREVLNKLTPAERLLIERPLPEDLPPDDAYEFS